jgi:uncharacterized membrane protein YesL
MNFLDSRLYAIVDRFSNLLILNIFWIVSCIPIVTIAPATSAMYSVVRQWRLHQDSTKEKIARGEISLDFYKLRPTLEKEHVVYYEDEEEFRKREV